MPFIQRKVQPLDLLIVVLLTGLLVIFYRTAWLADDAYITFRTVDNFVHGYGLTWNPPERVQAYTHPLWMFLLSGLFAVTQEIYFSSLLVSICLAIAAVVIVTYKVADSKASAIFGICLLIFSKAFVDYATSGLENPLTYLIIAFYLWVYLKTDQFSFRVLSQLSVLTALAMLNRMDTALLLMPGLIYGLYQSRRLSGVLAIALGFVPFVLWELFSLVYYGFPFPNTAYAKLNTGLAPATLAPHGLFYYLNSFRFDTLTLITIFFTAILTVFTKTPRKLFLTIGIGLYLAYIIRIGGDFMSGRFFAAPFFIAVAILMNYPWRTIYRSYAPALLGAFIVADVVINYPYLPLFSTSEYGLVLDTTVDGFGIEDARAIYYPSTGLLRATLHHGRPQHEWVDIGLAAKADAPCLLTKGGIGLTGFYTGPDVYIIDFLALSDPLLARLPYVMSSWRIGHYRRYLPYGYLETVATGQNHIVDKELASFYDQLSLVTRGDLFSSARLAAIWNLNFEYDQSKITDQPTLLPISVTTLTTLVQVPSSTKQFALYNGLDIQLGTPVHSGYLDLAWIKRPIEVSLVPIEKITVPLCASPPKIEAISPKNHRLLRILYLRNNRVIVTQLNSLSQNPQETDFTQKIQVPGLAATAGYDRIEITLVGNNYLTQPLPYIIKSITFSDGFISSYNNIR